MNTSSNFGATPADWESLSLWAGMVADLLPVVSNPSAIKSEKSTVAKPGKVPTVYTPDRTYRGIADWTDRVTTFEAIERWELEPDYGICIQTRRVRAIDVDVPDPAAASAIHDFAADFFAAQGMPTPPMRWRADSGKFLLAVQVQPGAPMPKRKFEVDGGIIEFLATGQQFVAVGTHPSGARYEWRDGTPQEFPVWTLEQFETFWSALHAAFGTTDSETGGYSERSKGEDLDLDDPLVDHLYEHGLVLDTKRDGALLVKCPWDHEHSLGTPGDSSTAYYPAGTQGYGHGAFKCLHGHCTGRTTRLFAKAVGYEAPREDPTETFGQFYEDDMAAVATAARERSELIEAQEARVREMETLIRYAPSISALEHELAPRIRCNGMFGKSALERLATAMHKRCSALGEKVSIRIVREWFRSPELHKIWPNTDANNRPLATIQNIEALCEQHGIWIVFNQLNHRQEIHIPGVIVGAENYESTAVARLKSMCAEVGISIGMPELKAYITAIADKNVFHPVENWINEKPWDGIDRLIALSDTIMCPSTFPESLKQMILRKWLIQAAAAVLSPVPIQLRGVMVVQGDQYIGKTRWLQSLAPAHMEFVATGRSIDPNNKDTVKIAISHWLCELGELDATFKKADIASLKAFISQDIDIIRLPYAPGESRFRRRTVFYASVNTPRFLGDETGNTRFWVIPVTQLKVEHGIDMQQMWAQVAHLYKAGEAYWFSQEEMQLLNRNAEDFQIEDPVLELLMRRFPINDWRSSPSEFDTIWLSASEVACTLDAPFADRISTIKVGKSLSRLQGIDSKKVNGVSRYRLPTRDPMDPVLLQN